MTPLKCSIAYNQLGGYCIPSSATHRPAASKILAGQIWEADTINYITSNFTGGDIVHAGAFFGDFLPALSNSLKKDEILWAFEPNEESYRCASITLIINDLKNVNLINAGLSDKNGEAILETHDTYGKALGGGSFIRQSQIINNPFSQETMQRTKIKTVALDAIIPSERNISIVHLDVEGYEQQAILGAMQFIKKQKPMLILETIPDQWWLENNLYSIGYYKKETVDKNTVFIIT